MRGISGQSDCVNKKIVTVASIRHLFTQTIPDAEGTTLSLKTREERGRMWDLSALQSRVYDEQSLGESTEYRD